LLIFLGRGTTGLGGTAIDHDDEYEPHVPGDYDWVILANHSMFGASPFSLGLFHPRTPPSLCRFIIEKLDMMSDTGANRYIFFQFSKKCHHSIPRRSMVV
jgi:hypothetical protein